MKACICALVALSAVLPPSLSPSAQAQSATLTPGAAAANFAAEPYVVRQYISKTEMNADGTGTREQTFVVQLQSEAALRLLGVLSFNFAKASETANIVYARVRRPDGTLIETPVADAQEQPEPVTREAPTYSDLMSIQLPLRSLHVGDTLEWQIRIKEVTPDAPGQFWGQEYFPKGFVILSEVHELSVPASSHVTVWTNPRAGVNASESVVNGRHTWTWQRSELSPTVGAAAEAYKLAEEKRTLTPEEELDATQGALPSIAWTTFPDWQAFGAWYRHLIAGQSVPDDAIRAKVAELTAGQTTPLAKAQAIYAYVSSQIRYVAVNFGIGRLKPHSAAEVFSNQFGDCKDKHTLLAAMLQVIDIQADPALVGVGVRFNRAVPSPNSFNHLITSTSFHGQSVWLDSTNEVAPWRALLAGIRDREALVIPPGTEAMVERTPADLPYPPETTAVVTSVLDSKLTAESEMTYTFHDDSELALRMVLRSVPPSSYAEAVQRMMANFGFAGTTSAVQISNLNDSAKPLVIHFHYHREHETSWGDNRVTFPFLPDFLPGFNNSQPPREAIDLSGPRTLVSTVSITLPAGWKVPKLPNDVDERSLFADGTETYHVKGSEIEATKKLVVRRKDLPAADFKRYQEWFEKANAGSTPFLDLTPPKAAKSK